jgi:hypothetical protein
VRSTPAAELRWRRECSSVRWGRRSSGHGILVWVEREAREDARRPRRCSPMSRSLHGWQWCGGGILQEAAHVGVRRGGAGARVSAKGATPGLGLGFYRGRKGEGRSLRSGGGGEGH